MWCPKCYTSDNALQFHIFKPDELCGHDGTTNVENPRLEAAWAGRVRPKNSFNFARRGDHLVIPFECDDCIFVKLRGKLPDMSSPQDRLLLGTIRRMNLDTFWSRESGTIEENARRADRMISICDTVGLPGPFIRNGMLPSYDHCGYQVAISILLLSRRPGKYSPNYTQYGTIRSYRATFSNFSRSSPSSNSGNLSMGDFNGNYLRLVSDDAGSFYFKRFMEGMRSRMGEISKPNVALSTVLLQKLVQTVEAKILEVTDEIDKHKWLVFLNYAVICYTISLRGPEGFLLDIAGLLRHWNRSPDYVVIALLGRIKGEHHDLAHLIPCAHSTKSGFHIKDILHRLLTEKQRAGLTYGPAISDLNGKLFSTKAIDDMFHETLTNIFCEEPSLFPVFIDSPDKIPTHYQCFRSFRRSSDTKAVEEGISITDINVVNRWKTIEDAKGKKPSHPMHLHYAQLEFLIDPFLRYTSSM